MSFRDARFCLDILLVLLLVASVVMFVWHTELWMTDMVDQGSMVFTNGWQINAPIHVYHVFMYVMFVLSFVVGVRSVYNSAVRWRKDYA